MADGGSRQLGTPLANVRRAWRRGEAGMNMDCMIMANTMKAEDMFALSQRFQRVVGYRQTDHRRLPGLGDPVVTGGGSH